MRKNYRVDNIINDYKRKKLYEENKKRHEEYMRKKEERTKPKNNIE